MILNYLYRFFRSFGKDPQVHWLFASLALGSAGFGLGYVVQGFPTSQVFLLGSLAFLAGWLLARIRNWFALLLAPIVVIIGWAAALIMQARLGPGLIAWFKAAYSVLSQYVQWREINKVDFQPLVLAGSEITTILSQAQDRLVAWFTAWEAGSADYNQLAIGLIWTCTFWILGMWTGWSFRRWRRPMVSLLPAGMLMIGSLNYVSGDSRYLLPFAGLLIGWSAVVTYKDAHRHWQANNIDYAEDIPMDFSIATSAIIVILLLVSFLAASVPMISVQAAAQWAREVFNPGSENEDAIARSFGLNREKPPTIFQQLGSGELPRKHLIGSGPELSQRVVMSVQVIPTDPSSQPGDEWAGWRYYWRSLTYDQYTGLGWQSSTTEELNLSDGSIIHPQEFPTQRLVEQQIRLVEDLGPTVYAAGDLLTIDTPFTVAFRPVGHAPNEPDTHLDVFGASNRQNTYRILSAVSSANLPVLRNASDRYPVWITERYLVLPPGIPKRVLDLASELTRGAPTPLDQAVLIQAYLRQFPYTLDLPAPPADRDIVDYFLFDLRKGYCDYYATAMVVMSRAIGIPARLAMGYASGIYDPVNERYLVSEADAHSWPEIYFSGYGWINFEPTGGLPEVQRPASSSFQPPSTLPPELLEGFHQPVARRLFNSWFVWVSSLAVFVSIGYLVRRYIRYSRLAPEEAIIETYRQFHNQVKHLVEPLPTGHTPLELASRLDQWFTTRQVLVRRFPNLKQVPGFALKLTDLYMEVIYSPHMLGKEGQSEARKLWEMLKLPLHISRFAGKLMPFKKDRP